MISKSQTIRQMIILSLAVLLLPMVIFPSRLGTQLMSFSFAFVMAELVFYGSVLFWSKRDTNLLRLTAGALICLAYRLILGFIFGGLVAIMYTMNLQISISLGMVSFVPAILCHVIVTPFILRPILNEMVFYHKARPRIVIDSAMTVQKKPKKSLNEKQNFVTENKKNESIAPWNDGVNKNFTNTVEKSDTAMIKNLNGFDRATQYIGENGSVLMAVVVDEEGLLLSHFVRDNISLDDWAPLALLFKQNNNQVLDRVGVKEVNQVSLTIDNMRVTVASEEGINLMVLADIQQDNVLNIRLTQGMEIIRKYMAERYSQELIVNAETKYV